MTAPAGADTDKTYPVILLMPPGPQTAEIAKGISFEKIAAPDIPEDTSIGDLSINHIRFTILQELPPP